MTARRAVRFTSTVWPFLYSAVGGQVVRNIYEPTAPPLPEAKKSTPLPRKRLRRVKT